LDGHPPKSFAALLISLRDPAYLEAFVVDRGGLRTLAHMSAHIVRDATARAAQAAAARKGAGERPKGASGDDVDDGGDDDDYSVDDNDEIVQPPPAAELSVRKFFRACHTTSTRKHALR
jgi:hypothetical protein